MSHSILFRTKLEALMGNATSGSVFNLITAANAVYDFLVNGDPDPTQAAAMDSKLHEVNDVVVDGELADGVLETFDTLTTELNALLS